MVLGNPAAAGLLAWRCRRPPLPRTDRWLAPSSAARALPPSGLTKVGGLDCSGGAVVPHLTEAIHPLRGGHRGARLLPGTSAHCLQSRYKNAFSSMMDLCSF